MRIFGDKNGTPIGIAGGSGPVKEPDGTALILPFDEGTNVGLARLIGEQTEWPNIRITESALLWHEKPIPINPDSEQRNEEKERQALIDRLFAESEGLTEEDVRAVLELVAARVGFRPTPARETRNGTV
jgi:hypothetical protein